MKRKKFIQLSTLAGAGMVFIPGCLGKSNSNVPAYLEEMAGNYQNDPRGTAQEWFRKARFGLFMHYGLYSLLGRHEWVQFREKIEVAEYAKLKDRFTAEKFDADIITDLALEAGMKYINITTRHHDSFCLFDSKYTDFKSTNSPAKRDLIAELAEKCNKKGLGLCLYYSHGRDWRHPHAPNNEHWGGSARPAYASPQSSYKYGEEHDLQVYVEFMKNQVTELLTNYGPIAAIWLDGIATPVSCPDRLEEFKLQELYDHIHSLQPQVLISYKQGITGTEDFLAPERSGNSPVERTRKRFGEKAGLIAEHAWEFNKNKPKEICDTLQPKGWGYMAADEGKHKTPDQVVEMLRNAARIPANLLLNTGPLPSGEIHPDDVKTLQEIGKRIRTIGWGKLIK